MSELLEITAVDDDCYFIITRAGCIAAGMD